MTLADELAALIDNLSTRTSERITLRRAVEALRLATEQRDALMAACEEWLAADSPYVSLAEQRRRWPEISKRMREACEKARIK